MVHEDGAAEGLTASQNSFHSATDGLCHPCSGFGREDDGGGVALMKEVGLVFDRCFLSLDMVQEGLGLESSREGEWNSPERALDLDDWLGGWNLPKGYLRFASVAATLLVLLPGSHEGGEEADDDAEEEGGQK